MAIIRNGMTYDVETVLQKVQSDWNQTDDTQLDFIKNKPNINGAIGELIDEMNANSVMGVAHDITEDGAARLTFTGISQTNGVIGVGEGTETLVFEKIATNAVAGNFTVDYTYSNGVIGTITGQEATDDITDRLTGLEGLPTYHDIICDSVANTPYGVKWMDGSTEIVGELEAQNAQVHTIYLVKQNTATGDTYDEYVVINHNETPTWEKLGSTSADLKGYVKTIKLGDDGQTIDVDTNTTNLTLPIHNVNTATGVADGLATAYDVQQNALLTKDIEVMGVTVGNITSEGDGYTFKKGMSLTEIIKAIFQKVIGAAVNQDPSLTFTSAYSGNYEVGYKVPNFTLSTVINNKGSYKSADTEVFKLKYGKDSNDNIINADTNGILTANCTIGNIEFTATGATVDRTTGVVNGFTVVEGTNATLKTTANATSDVTPYRNDDTAETSVRFNNFAITNTPTKTISGRYRYWYGYCKYSPDSSYNYDDIFTFENGQLTYDPTKATMTSAWYTPDSSIGGLCKVAGTGEMDNATTDFPCAVLILPKTFRTEDDAHGHIQHIFLSGSPYTGEEADNKFLTANTFTYKCNENADPITYVVRVKNAGLPQTYTEIYF